MREFLTESALFGVVLSLAAFQIGVFVRKKTGISFLTPLVTAMAIIIVFLVVTDIDYEAYNEGAKKLASQVANLNQVYGNMLGALV